MSRAKFLPSFEGFEGIARFCRIEAGYATDNYLARVRTRNVLHKTPAGIHPGLDWSDGILSMCRGIALTSSIPGGEEISCPFVGISFEVKDGEILRMAVMSPARR